MRTTGKVGESDLGVGQIWGFVVDILSGDEGNWRFNLEVKKKRGLGASLVAQWLGICLLMQGARVRALVWEDPTCRGAARPVSHNY